MRCLFSTATQTIRFHETEAVLLSSVGALRRLNTFVIDKRQIGTGTGSGTGTGASTENQKKLQTMR